MDAGTAAILGAIVGGVTTFAGTVLTEIVRSYLATRADRPRKALLNRMLEDARPWRKISTLSRVIGSSESDTRRLLVEIGARGSETPGADGEVWGLIARHPLGNTAN
jgi:hypothetical protein